jgi:hypothetical protein
MKLTIFASVAALAAAWGVASLWFYWTDPTNTLPMGSILSRENLTLVKQGDQTKPAIVLLDASENECRLALVNPTPVLVYYHGYTVESEKPRRPRGQISPLYGCEYQDEFGGWSANALRWCGTGAALMAIPPGRAGVFRVACNAKDRPIRVSVTCQWSGDVNRQDSFKVYSDSVPR